MKHDFLRKRLSCTLKIIVFMIFTEWCCFKAKKQYCQGFLLFNIGNLSWSWFKFTSRFKAREWKNDYLNSHDHKNDAFFMIYFVIQVVSVITPTFTMSVIISVSWLYWFYRKFLYFLFFLHIKGLFLCLFLFS